MAKAKAKTIAKVKKKPVKAGSSMPKNVGGIANAKVTITVKKLKDG
jgi:hypothetical protein